MDSKHTKEGYDQVETSHGEDDQKMPPKDAKMPTLTAFEDIKAEEFDSTTYMKCGNVGKAVIVSNFMDGYTPKRGLNVRSYAKNDCDLLEETLKHLGFQPFDDKENRMVYKNLTKREFEALYNRVAKETDYRPKGKEGYTCVLFIVMSYGRSGLIQCHAEPGDQGDHPFVEQKHIQEAFQPQHNPSLALKPKLFIIQTIPKGTDIEDGNEPKADFLTYTSDIYCINSDHGNCFIKAIVDVLKDKKESAMEIQRVLIRMNKKYKDYSNSDKKIPCRICPTNQRMHCTGYVQQIKGCAREEMSDTSKDELQMICPTNQMMCYRGYIQIKGKDDMSDNRCFRGYVRNKNEEDDKSKDAIEDISDKSKDVL
ncbi:CASP3 [Mytilus coruscus]|uniref:CASP3 n=1 Tax=Mytilus coruscus TaxID=42192 RepID=A0A6J8DRB3_MYTCO|nr:CASP3 [Mytilus coruscus]